VKLLIDNALSPLVAAGLRDAGHDVVHVRDRGLGSAPDEVILELAHDEGRISVSADSDFAMLLATRITPKPSFVLLRPAPDTPLEQTAALLANLPQLALDLEEGAIAVIEPGRVRVRRLPIEDEEE
jgi:predicted nuclease of predicted toxin-antitoxin system